MLPYYAKYPCETIPLTTGKNETERVPYTSGLNWGQRPGRNPDQAYLPLPSRIQRSNFFPPPGQTFTIITDDDQVWVCARRQANGKAIHTISDNSIIGSYFRCRLGLQSGDLVVLTHLLKYGRTSVELYKVKDFEYVLDFKPY